MSTVSFSPRRERTPYGTQAPSALMPVQITFQGDNTFMRVPQTFRRALPLAAVMLATLCSTSAFGSESSLVIPDAIRNSDAVNFFGMSGHTLLLSGLFVCVLGLLFGLVIYAQLKAMPAHITPAQAA